LRTPTWAAASATEDGRKERNTIDSNDSMRKICRNETMLSNALHSDRVRVTLLNDAGGGYT
jgi:hypothetical protein